MTTISFEVNGSAQRVEAEPAALLVDVLRGPLALTGTHNGCDTMQCGACTVLVDGQAVKSCAMLAVQAQGRRVTTVEGLAAPDGAPHALQDAFIACHGLQCGFCTPGMLMAAAALLAETLQPSDDEIVAALEGNLCRCTGYVNIVAAVREAARQLAGGRAQ